MSVQIRSNLWQQTGCVLRNFGTVKETKPSTVRQVQYSDVSIVRQAKRGGHSEAAAAKDDRAS